MDGIDTLTAAELSKAAYDPIGQAKNVPPGWIANYSKPYSDHDSFSNTQFITYINSTAKQAVITFRGSVPELPGQNFISDLADDGYFAWAHIKPYAETALGEIQHNYPGYQIFTDGHSLGGGLAQTLALEHALSGYGQNSLPISSFAIMTDLQGTYEQEKAAYQAQGASFHETNVDNDIATSFYSKLRDQNYLDPSPTTLYSEYGTAVTVGVKTGNPLLVLWGSANAHLIGNLLSALGSPISSNGSALRENSLSNASAINDAAQTDTTVIDSSGAVAVVEADGTQAFIEPSSTDAGGYSYLIDQGGTSQVASYTSDGTVTVSSYSGLDAGGTKTSDLTDYTNGQSQLASYNPTGGVSETLATYANPNGTGPLITEVTNLTSGQSQVASYDQSGNVPYYGVPADVKTFSEAGGNGNLVSDLSNLPNGGSQYTAYNPSTNVSRSVQTYDGPNGTGDPLTELEVYSDNTSKLYTNEPSSTVLETTQTFSTPDPTGTPISETIEYSSGQSQLIEYNPFSDVTKEVLTFSKLGEMGQELTALEDLADGTSAITTYHDPSTGTLQDVQTFTSADGQGTEVNQTIIYANSTSQLISFDQFGDGTKDVQTFADVNGNRTEVSDLQDMADGSSKLYSYNPSPDITQTEQTFDAQGGLVSSASNYANKTSEDTTYGSSNDGSQTTAYFSGPNETGMLNGSNTDFSNGQMQSVYYPPSANTSQEYGISPNGTLDNVTMNYGNDQSSVTTGYETGFPETNVYSGPYGTGFSTGTTGPEGPTIDLGGAGGSGGYNGGGTGAEGAGGTGGFSDAGGGGGGFGDASVPILLDAVVSSDYSNAGVINTGTGYGSGNALDTSNPASGVAEIVTRYSGPGTVGRLLSTLINYSKGTSQLTEYNPSSNVTKAEASYAGPDGTGSVMSRLVDFTNGQSSVTTGYGAGRSQTTVYSGPDGTGSVVSATRSTGPGVTGSTLAAEQDLSLNVTTPGETNKLRVALTGGTTYWFNAAGSSTSQGTISDPYLRLLDKYGATQIAFDQGNGVGSNSFMSYTSAKTGTYYIEGGSSSGRTGTYSLNERVADDYPSNPATPGILAVGVSVVGTYDFVADTDWFRASLTKGATYQFTMESTPTGPGTDIHPRLRLFGDDGVVQLAYGDSGSASKVSVTYTPAVTGTYYVSAESYGSNVGTYQLSEAAISGTTSSSAAESRLSFISGSDGMLPTASRPLAVAIATPQPASTAAAQALLDPSMNAIPPDQLFPGVGPVAEPQYAAGDNIHQSAASLMMTASNYIPPGTSIIPYLSTS